MRRTLIVHNGERIIKKDNWFVLQREGEEQRIPLEDIYCVVIDNQRMMLSVAVLTEMTRMGAHIMLCDAKHMPATVIYPHTNYYRPLNILRKQVLMDEQLKDELWAAVVKAKLVNQAKALELSHGGDSKSKRILELSEEVMPGDSGNREGIGAKLFFRAMYGAEFIRMADDGINAALNYGYTIIRSAITKTLCAYGYNTVWGIHHINEQNHFNLADDMMEPWRPLVDLWVDTHHEELLETLSKEQRTELIGLVNRMVLFQGKRMKVHNAIDRYIASLTSALEKGDVTLLKFPMMIHLETVTGSE